MKTLFTCVSILFLALLCFPTSTVAFQARDHLTPEEVELVKDTQVLDKRIDLFIKAADRRVAVLTGTTPANAKKDSEKWGEMPNGTPAQLLGDIAKIFDEAITNIDDVSSRDEKNPLIPKALRKLATAATRIVEQVRPFAASSKGGSEGSSFDQLAENTDAIIQAAGKLPPEVAKKGKTKGEKPKEIN